ncbi:MAG: F0F1 ATP synthase subunit B [Marinilabilia sp.]
MELLTPSPGLVFWTSLTFIILLVVLRRYAWPSILRALKVREETITYALEDAKKAREEIEMMEQKRRQIREEARKERDNILKEARRLKSDILEEARETAQKESDKMLEQANQQIKRQRQEALYEIRDTIGRLSLDIAEKVIKEELSDPERQKKVINTYLNQMNFN